MALAGGQHTGGMRFTLLPALTIAGAVSATATTPVTGLLGMNSLIVECLFLYGSGGTNVNAYVQTSLDGGVTWFDVMNFLHTTAALTRANAVSMNVTNGASPFAPIALTDGTMTSNTSTQGILGDRVRLKYVTTGTYGGATSLAVFGLAKG